MADEEVKIPEAHVEAVKEQDTTHNFEEGVPAPAAPAEASEDDLPKDREQQSTLESVPASTEEQKVVEAVEEASVVETDVA